MIKRSCLALLAGLPLLPALATAHSPVFDCFVDTASSKETGKRITCEGGFSDGSSATGVAIRVLDAKDKLLLQGKIDAEGRFSFARPNGDFHVIFDGGAGHSITLFSSDISE